MKRKRITAMVCVLFLTALLCACGSSKGSGINLASLEKAASASAGSTINFNVVKKDNGSSFTRSFKPSAYSSILITISGSADKKDNVTAVKYTIEGEPDYLEGYYKSLNLQSLRSIEQTYMYIPGRELDFDIAILGYSPIASCLMGESTYTDFYGLDTVINARESSQVRGNWTFSTSLNGAKDAVIISAAFNG